MKKLLFILSVFCFTAINGQNVFTLTPGVTIYGATPNPGSALLWPPELTLENMDLINESNTAYVNIRFSGNTNSTISGTGGPYGDGKYYFGFEIAKTNGSKVILLQDPHIERQVVFTSGLLDLNGHILHLRTYSSLFGESENKRVIGASGGYIRKSFIETSDPGGEGGLGIKISSPDINNTIYIRRGNVPQTGNLGSGTGIQRWFDVSEQSPNASSISVHLNYFDAELNGLNENDLVFWSSSDMINWTNNGYTTRNTTDNYVELSNITNFQGKYFTLAPGGSPRPITSAPQQIKTTAVRGKETITNKWSTWPNPAGKILCIDITSNSASLATTSIFDSKGSLIRTQTNHLMEGVNRLAMDLKNLAAGIYYISTSWDAGKEKRSSNFVKL